MSALNHTELAELQLSIAALETPESKAFGDYINGKDLADNPYTAGSDDYASYAWAMHCQQVKEVKEGL